MSRKLAELSPIAMVLQVKVARSASRDWKLYTGRSSSVRLALALRLAASERAALAATEARSATLYFSMGID